MSQPTTGFDIYKHYVALKAHFNTDSYDYIKHNGKTRSVRRQTYERRQDRQIFEMLARRRMDYVLQFLLANFIAKENLWIGDVVLNKQAEDNYFQWKRRVVRKYDIFAEETRKIKKFLDKHQLSFRDLIDCKRDDTTVEYPIIFRLLIQNHISLETFIMLDAVLRLMKKFDQQLKGDYLYDKWELKIRKYKRFLPVDKNKITEILESTFC